VALYPYLMFGGDCREAFARYEEIFGGTLDIMPMSDAPREVRAQWGPEADHLVLHAALSFGDGDLLMGSDDPTGDFAGMSGMAVNYSTADPGDVRRVYETLADGGQVTMPLGETFWSPLFGMCTDRFGVSWMVNAEPSGAEGT
jgi:PhnB protein